MSLNNFVESLYLYLIKNLGIKLKRNPVEDSLFFHISDDKEFHTCSVTNQKT